MTKLEKLSKAHKLAIKTGNFSLLDEIHHPEYSFYDPRTGLTNNYDYWKVMLQSFKGFYGPNYIIYEKRHYIRRI